MQQAAERLDRRRPLALLVAAVTRRDKALEGVYFGMWNGSSTVRCFVTRAALTDKAQGSGQAESLHIFHEYRSEIENLASAKYDAGKITSDGVVVVDSPDLNPEQFQQGFA
jgi:hypothetical protein